MTNPARILAKLRSEPTEISYADLKILLEDLDWSVREGKGSHVVATSPRGYNITIARSHNKVKRGYLRMILKEVEASEGT